MSVPVMCSRKRRHIAGTGFLGSTFHYFGKKLNGESHRYTDGGSEYYNPKLSSRAAPYYSPALPEDPPFNNFGFPPGWPPVFASGLRKRKRAHKSKR